MTNDTELDTKLAEIQALVDKATHITTLEWKNFANSIDALRFLLQTIAELRKDRELLEWYSANPHALGYGNAYHGRMGGWHVSSDHEDEWPTLRQAINAARGKEKV